jgi:hypothetical protein
VDNIIDYIPNFSKLNGATIHKIEGCTQGSDRILFYTSVGIFQMMHHYNCCESVDVEDVCGDPNDIVDALVVKAEESSSENVEVGVAVPEGWNPEWKPESYTWTYYRLITTKGDLDIRWFGSSNGYYSERVNFEQIRDPSLASD